MMETINAVSEIRRWNSGDGEPQANRSSDRAYHSEPPLDATGAVPVYSVVKWFNPIRGFGFVVLSDGSGEAFLHRNILAQSGIDAVEPCAVLKVRVMQGDPRPKIVEVLSVDNSAVTPTSRYQKARPGQRTTPEAGTVSLWRADKGYGFIARDGGGRRIFSRLLAKPAEGFPPFRRSTRRHGRSREAERAKSYEHPSDITCVAARG